MKLHTLISLGLCLGIVHIIEARSLHKRDADAPYFRCSFEDEAKPLCGGENYDRDEFNWTIIEGPTPSDPTGPSKAKDGTKYIFIETSSPTKYNDTAIYLFPDIFPEGDCCVEFEYHMYGFHINALQLVQIADIEATVQVIKEEWVQHNEQGDLWLHAQADVSIMRGSRLAYIGTRGGGYTGDIAVDDVIVYAGSCDGDTTGTGYDSTMAPAPATTMASASPKNRTPAPSTMAPVSVSTVHSGASTVTPNAPSTISQGTPSTQFPSAPSTMSPGTALPPAPATTTQGAATTRTSMPASTKLPSAVTTISPTGVSTLSPGVSTVASGSTMPPSPMAPSTPSMVPGTVSTIEPVTATVTQGSGTTFRSPRSTATPSASVTTSSYASTRYTTQVTTNSGTPSPTDAASQSPTNSLMSTDTLTPTKNSGAPLFSCSFESSELFCNMDQSKSDNFDWSRLEGSTPSKPTGPQGASAGSFFIYIEASSPRVNGDVAIISIPTFKVDSKVCVSFDYNMYGYHIGTLNLLRVFPDGKSTIEWTRKGDQGPEWYTASLEVSLTGSDKLAFRATRAKAYSGDIAIDNIEVYLGTCGGSNNPGTVSPTSGNTMSSSTPSPSTASPGTASPSTASQSTASPGTASPNTASPSTELPSTSSPSTASPSTASQSTGSPSTSSPSTAAPSTASPTTTTSTTTTTTTSPTTTTTTASTTTTDSFKPEPTVDWTCSFEDDQDQAEWCQTQQESNIDEFDWTLHSGNTPSDPTGPSSAYSGSYYAFIEATNPRNQGDKAVLRLPSLNTVGRVCVQFEYHMYGHHIDRLQIGVFHWPVSAAYNMMAEIVGEKGNQWYHAQMMINLTHGKDQIAFIGIRGEEYAGDIAIDSISITSAVCQSNMGNVQP